LWDARTWAPIGSYKDFPSSSLHTRALAFSREQDWIAVGTQDGRVQIADVRTGELIRSWKAHAEPVTALAVSQDSRLIATASGYSDTTVVIWSATDGTEDSVL